MADDPMRLDLSDVKYWLEERIGTEQAVVEELRNHHGEGARILTGKELKDFSRAKDHHLARMFTFIETWEFVSGEEWSG